MDTQEQKEAQVRILDYLLINLCSCETCMQGKLYIQKTRNQLNAEINSGKQPNVVKTIKIRKR